MKDELLVQVIKNMKKEGYYCLVTELDELDRIIMKTPVFEHFETAVCDCLYRIKFMFGEKNITIRMGDKKNEG